MQGTGKAATSSRGWNGRHRAVGSQSEAFSATALPNQEKRQAGFLPGINRPSDVLAALKCSLVYSSTRHDLTGI